MSSRHYPDEGGRNYRRGVADPITLTCADDREAIAMATRRFASWIGAAWILALAGMPFFCTAQPYPSKPIRLILAQGPGSGSDVIGRMCAVKLSEGLGQRYVTGGHWRKQASRVCASPINKGGSPWEAAPSQYIYRFGNTEMFIFMVDTYSWSIHVHGRYIRHPPGPAKSVRGTVSADLG